MLIEEYFQTIENDIVKCPCIAESRITRDKRSLYIGIAEGSIYFTDESVLYFIEFVNVRSGIEKYKYSYHYQDKNNKLIFRYDMAPHHRNIETFPHHKHLSNGEVVKSDVPILGKVLDEIENMIKLF